ncbi:hypothetical protein [Alteromonas gilva]|uniref:Uncharacterized protein n=1 Tax=Alteromonas gilva TaxID=2987522 RepID=A0ABT5L4I1_9ALTE|nr:hypothetical protein [Alteromonas gilva]MDC8831945.1 hypothetical protein [Alteromonas gilva]
MQRPLLKHIRDHKALFLDISRLRDNAIAQLGFTDYEFWKTPKFVSDTGERFTIEPERSIILPDFRTFKGLKRALVEAVPGLRLVEQSDCGYRYPTAALAGLDAPFIKRLRSEYFHRVGEDRSICRPVNLSYGIKSRGKADNRLEYEVWVPDNQLEANPMPLLVEKYGEDLPDDIRHFAQQKPLIHGWMGVKRAAFEALYYNPAVMGELVICIGMSVDAYNIGARPDLSFSPVAESSIAASNAEFEWEVMGYYAPAGVHYEHDALWAAINHSLEAIGEPVSDIYANDIMPIMESKTERILSTVHSHGVTTDEIRDLDLQPWEFLQTTSERRVKPHDPSRKVNFLGRLNRLFYQPERQLPSIESLHDLIAG